MVRHFSPLLRLIFNSTSLAFRFKRTGKRDEIFLATKFGFTANGVVGTPQHVKEAAAKSLKALGVDHIDLYYAHRSDPKTPIEVSPSNSI